MTFVKRSSAILAIVAAFAITSEASAQTCTVANCPAGYNQITAPPYFGTAGSDCMIGTAANDTMLGLGGADFICGNGGNDTILGGDGNDQITGDDGDDTILGGNDDDTIDGGAGADNLFGDAGSDTLVGGAGNDSISGGDDNDFAFGGDGNDTIQGEGGNDFLGGDGDDDVLLGGDGTDTLLGGPGDDRLEGEAGDDPFLSGGDGNDVVNGGAGDDTMFGNDGIDELNGGADDDTISGGAGPDIINGNDGDDTLNGDTENDTLDGGAGTDTLSGGSGYDNCLNGEGTTGCELFSHVTVASFVALAHSGQTVVQWSTSSEAATVGFELFRQSGSSWSRVHEGVLPGLVSAPAGGVYEVRDPRAGGGTHRYMLIEHTITGQRQAHGPFAVKAQLGAPVALRSHATFVRQPRALRLGRSLNKAATEIRQSPGEASGVYFGVDTTGEYEVSASQIAQVLGLPTSAVQERIATGALQLTEGGEPVAWQASQDGAAITFIGFAIDSLYTQHRLYRVTLGDGDLIALADATPVDVSKDAWFIERKHFEVDRLAGLVIATDPRSDYWFWQLVSAAPAMPENATVTMTLDAVSTAFGDATVKVDLHGVSDDEHTIDVVINDQPIGTVSFSGTIAQSAEFEVPISVLQAGDNTLTLVATGSETSMVFLNSVDLEVPRAFSTGLGEREFSPDFSESIEIGAGLSESARVFDVTDRNDPLRLVGVVFDAGAARLDVESGRDYLITEGVSTPSQVWGDVPSSLRSPDNAAEYLLVTPASLVSTAQTLADHRQAQGHSVAVVELQDIYDEFAAGVPTPEAIADFVQYAHSNWRTAPKYLVLVGKGSFDYRGLTGQSAVELVPPVMATTDSGLFASDMSYGDVDNDGVSDVAVGRLPVTNATELTRVIAKLIDHDTRVAEFADRGVMVADRKDPASDFAVASDVLADSLPRSWAVDRVYRDDSTLEIFRDELLTAIDGAPRIINYLGHAGTTSLGKEELLIDVGDVKLLSGAGPQPIYTLMTCLASRFEVGGLTSVGEALLVEEGGASAVWGPSGLSIDAQAQVMARALFEQGLGQQGVLLGDAITSAQRELLDNDGTPDMTRIYQLFGDPASQLVPKSTGTGGGRCSLSHTNHSNAPIGFAVLMLCLVIRRRV